MRVQVWLQLATTRRCATPISAPLHVCLEGRKLLGPKLLGLLQPGLEPRDRFWPQLVDAHARIELRMGFLDQSAESQHPQMAAHRGRRQLQYLSQLASAPRSLAEQVDGSPPVGICQRGERAVEVAFTGRTQSEVLIVTSPAAAISSSDMRRTV